MKAADPASETRSRVRATAVVCAALATAHCAASTTRAASQATASSPAPASHAPVARPAPAATSAPAAGSAVAFGAGATIQPPPSWTTTRGARRVAFESPEQDLRFTVLEAEGASAEAAIAAAWQSVDPRFALEVEHRSSPPADRGWDEVTQLTYRTPPSESRTVIAVAWRKGRSYYVALVDGTQAGLSRRGAQLMASVQSLRAPGVEEESWAGRTPHALDGERLRAFEQFVQTAMSEEDVPGVAIGVVQNGALVYSHGFGVRALGGHDAVTPRTLFMIGSNTKSLTTLMMARLVDEGRFRWDTPVVQVLPAFHLADAAVTGRMDMQHTVCACTGMPRRDLEFVFEFARATPAHWLELLGTMSPTTGFGEVFQYSNLLVAAGGYAAAHAARPALPLERAVEQTMHDEVFAPLGMRSTTLSMSEALRHEHADPHGRTLENHVERFPTDIERGVESVGPAGAAWSNVEDLARYLTVELRSDTLPDGRRYLSEAAMTERRRARVRIDEHAQYALGLVVNDAHGVTEFTHGGNTLGFSSNLAWYPELGLGFVILTNGAGANRFLSVVQRRLLELLVDAREEAADALRFHATDLRQHYAEIDARVDVAPPRAWYASWLGDYRNADLGTLRLVERDGRLVLDAGEWASRVGRQHDAHDETGLVLLDAPLAGVEFQPPTIASAGAIVLDYPQRPYRFERVAGAGESVARAPVHGVSVAPGRP